MTNYLKLLLQLLSAKHRQELGFVMLFAVVMAALEAISLVLIVYLISCISDPGEVLEINVLLNAVGVKAQAISLNHLALIVLVVVIAKNGYSLWNDWYQSRYLSEVRHTLSTQLLDSILSKPYSFFLSNNTDILTSRFLADVDRIGDGFLRALVMIIGELLVASAIVAVLLLKAPEAAVAILIGLIVGAALLHLILRGVAKRISHGLTRTQQSRYFFGGMIMAGIKGIKAGGSEPYFWGRFSAASLEFSRFQVLQMLILHSPKAIIETVAVATILIMLLVTSVDQGLSGAIPIVVLFATAAYRILPSLNRVLSALQLIRLAQEPVEAVYRMMVGHANGPLMAEKSLVSPLPFEREIALHGISYQYPGAAGPSINRLTTTISKNEFVGIVGSSGAGKSTLIDIILGLLHPSHGSLRVDGVLVGPDNAAAWRRNIGYVPQSIFLTDDTIAQNIAFGRGATVDMEEVRRVARLAQIDNFICTELPSGYETEVGENGVRLSGGQRQRIGIARALYGGSSVLLLDEATSALDGQTESQLAESISSLAGSLTIISVSHRLSSLGKANRIMVLERGELVADGPEAALAQTCPRFIQLACLDAKDARNRRS